MSPLESSPRGGRYDILVRLPVQPGVERLKHRLHVYRHAYRHVLDACLCNYGLYGYGPLWLWLSAATACTRTDMPRKRVAHRRGTAHRRASHFEYRHAHARALGTPSAMPRCMRGWVPQRPLASSAMPRSRIARLCGGRLDACDAGVQKTRGGTCAYLPLDACRYDILVMAA